MARDFRAKQVRTSIIIGSGSVESTKPHLGLVFYSASKASDFNGTRKTGGDPISIQSAPGQDTDKLNLTDARIGDDVWCLFDGHPQAAGAMANERTYGSTVLFLGNVAVSGSLFAERQTIEVDSTIAGNFVTPETTNHYLAGGFHGTVQSGDAGGCEILKTGDFSTNGFVRSNTFKNYDSQHLTITSETAGNIKFRSKASGENSGNELDIFDFNVHAPSLTIFDDADVDGDRDYFKVEVGAHGSTTLSTHSDSDSSNSHLVLLADADINFDSTSGYFGFRKGSGDESTSTNEHAYLKATGNNFEFKGYGNGSDATISQTIFSFIESKRGASTGKPTARFSDDIKLEFRDADIYIQSHEAAGLKMEADGNMLIGSTLVDEKTLTLGNTASTHMLLSPSATAGNEKILIKNALGDTDSTSTDAAIRIWAAAGGITLDAEKSIRLDANGGQVKITDDGASQFLFNCDGMATQLYIILRS